MGINYIYNPILLYFQFFNLFVQICEISGHTFSISHKNEDPSPLWVQKSNRNIIATQNGYHVIWQSLGMKLVWLKSH